MATAIRDRAIKLLGENIPQHIVASAVGVTESYISQLMAEEAVAEEVAQLRAAKLEDQVEAQDLAVEIRKSGLKLLKQRLIYAKSPLELARVVQIVDNMKKVGETNNNTTTADVVTITLPAAARGSVSIQLNETNQVIEVEGRSMAPLPSKVLPQLMAHRKALQAPEPATTIELPAAPTAKPDTAVAAEKLAKLKDITTVMDGVQLVL